MLGSSGLATENMTYLETGSLIMGLNLNPRWDHSGFGVGPKSTGQCACEQTEKGRQAETGVMLPQLRDAGADSSHRNPGASPPSSREDRHHPHCDFQLQVCRAVRESISVSLGTQLGAIHYHSCCGELRHRLHKSGRYYLKFSSKCLPVWVW